MCSAISQMTRIDHALIWFRWTAAVQGERKEGLDGGGDGAAAGGDGDAPRSAACTGGARDAQPFLRGGHGGDTPGGAHTPHLDVLHAAGEMCR